ncbi:YeiH family protein [Merismopedia glauca]|uniref:Putative sulfate exporter family transporter n=1 Tax=Merismopedia glauca CCAP 1448/3 TaxID=1296344 RepID=A0A2T1C974_9CYAN|nr:putative sulfate exporter family transporter [Merismopedia glauca]PSB04832.1 putative sulfate exporter family transporter [Merismopedia glauca CCAP 1448/3]
MAQLQISKQEYPAIFSRFFFIYLPGILCLFGLGYAGKLVEQSVKQYGKVQHITLPNIEYVLWAILFGVIIANTVGIPRILRPGVITYEFWLRVGIVLLGARFLLGDILKLGGVSLLLVGIELALAIAVTTVIGRFFGLSHKITSLLAIGSSICGVSAIIAGKGAIEAEDEDAAFAIAIILVLGAFGLFVYPLIGQYCHLSSGLFGLWAGLVIDNTAEAISAGTLYSDEAGKIATLVKASRNATIGFVVLGFALFWASRGKAGNIEHKGLFIWQKFPKFILGFLFISLLGTFGILKPEQLTSLGNLSRWSFLLAFSGVGLSINFRQLAKLGIRPIIVALSAKIAIVYVMLAILLLLDSLGLLGFAQLLPQT